MRATLCFFCLAFGGIKIGIVGVGGKFDEAANQLPSRLLCLFFWGWTDSEEKKIKLNLQQEAKGVYNVTLSNGKKTYNGKAVFE